MGLLGIAIESTSRLQPSNRLISLPRTSEPLIFWIIYGNGLQIELLLAFPPEMGKLGSTFEGRSSLVVMVLMADGRIGQIMICPLWTRDGRKGLYLMTR